MPLIKAPKTFKPPVHDPDARDRALDYFWQITDEQFDEVIAPRLAKRPGRKLRTVIRRLVAAALRAYRENGTGYLSYSRTHAFYSDQPYGGDDLYTCWLIKGGVDLLDVSGLIDHDRALPGQRGFQSRFALLPWVVDLLDGRMEYRGRPEIKLRDADRNPLPIADNDLTRRLKAEVQEIRAYLRDVKVTMPDCCERIGPHHWNVPILDDDGNPILDQDGNPKSMICREDPYIDIYRVFSRGDASFSLGGRWYWSGQSLPSNIRAKVLIDGKKACEEDFRAMHTRELYALEGIDYLGDPYVDVIEHDREFGSPLKLTRDDVKPGLNIALNARTLSSAIGATARKLRDKDRLRIAGLITAIKSAHPLIAHHFHADVGLMLMRHESEIALAVMRKARDRGLVVLPVHDSFLCDAERRSELRAIMDEAWAEWAARFRKDGVVRVVVEPMAEAATALAPEASEVVADTEGSVLQDGTPAPAGAGSGRVFGGHGPLGPLSERFFLSAVDLYGDKAKNLLEHMGSKDGSDHWTMRSSRSPAMAADIQFVFGLWGLEAVGLPVPRDFDVEVHRAFGRDMTFNPIDERTLERLRPKRAYPSVRKAKRRPAGLSKAPVSSKSPNAPKTPSRSLPCATGLSTDAVMSTILAARPTATVTVRDL